METFYNTAIVQDKETILIEKDTSTPSTLFGFIDLSAIQKNERFSISYSIKVKPNGEYRRWALDSYQRENCPTVRITEVPTGFGFKLAMKRIKGQDRSFDWLVTVK